MDSHISHGLYVTVSVTVISLREAAASKSGNVARGVQARDRDRGANTRDRGETEARPRRRSPRPRRGVGTPRGGLETEALRPRPQPCILLQRKIRGRRLQGLLKASRQGIVWFRQTTTERMI